MIPNALQLTIKRKVEESRKVRIRSKRLLEIAKHGVEMAIEINEKTAQGWMEQEIKGLDSSLRWNGDRLDSVSITE